MERALDFVSGNLIISPDSNYTILGTQVFRIWTLANNTYGRESFIHSNQYLLRSYYVPNIEMGSEIEYIGMRHNSYP